LNAGFHDVPRGHVATVVTHLEMRAPPGPRDAPDLPAEVSFDPVAAPEPDWYRDLFNRVGGQDWLWFSRLTMADSELAAILSNRDVSVHALSRAGRAEALLELDFRTPGECELAFFGVTPALIGLGAGRWLLTRATELAWARPIGRFHVHTCTLDHPSALSFYRRGGFDPVRQQVEIAPDPRLSGALPETAAPHIPIFR
jgi:GNAT superfamily N-acetyltransferase